MKRIFVSAVTAGLISSLAGAAIAETGAPSAGPGASQNIFGQPDPSQNVVQPEQSRGQLGGLASGAPGFAANLRNLRGPANGAAAQAVEPPATAPAVEGQAVATETQVVEKQTVAPALSVYQVAMVINHCFLHSPRKFHQGPPPFAPMFVGVGWMPGAPVPPLGDLELIDLGMVSDVADEQGPLYRVTIRNNSTIPSRHFQVSLIAVLGRLSHSSPVVTVTVDEIAAGATHDLDVQLPPGVLSLGPANEPAPFERLIVAIDSFDELLETNELNNVAVWTRSEIAVIEVATTDAAEAPAEDAAPEGDVSNGTAPNDASPKETDPLDGIPDDFNTDELPQPNDTAPQTPPPSEAAPSESSPPSDDADDGLESLVPQENDNAS